MNIKIDKLQSLHILTEVTEHNILDGLQGGRSDYFIPVRPTGHYLPRPYQEYLEFTIDGIYHHNIPTDQFGVTVNRENENNYRFSEIGHNPRITQSVMIAMPFNNDTSDAVIALSDSVQLGAHNAIRNTFDAVVTRYDQTGILIISVHLRGCTVTSIEAEEGGKAKFIIHPQAVFYVC